MTTGWRVVRDEQGEATASYGELNDGDLGDGDVLVDIAYSSLNYKDALALRGDPGVARISPLVPGIDLVGTVAESVDDRWSPGDRVLVNGWGLGETHAGGYATQAKVGGGVLTALPEGMTPRRAAAIGTAGFTAMLAVMAIEDAALGDDAEVLVTGASGGVGSVAIALLASLGVRAIASTGRTGERHYLHELGAHDVIDRSALADAGRPLQKQRWAAVIDSVGGTPLVNALAQTRYDGVVAACGLAASADLPATVLPFILRGVSLVGINSVECPVDRREEAWQRLATQLDPERLDAMTTSVRLEEVGGLAPRILEGAVRGRTVVEVAPRAVGD